MIGGSGEKKTLRTVAKYADMWNAMGPVDVMRHKIEVLRAALRGRRPGHPARSSSRSASRRRSATAQAEADEVWKAAMEHNRTPLSDVADDDTFWNGTRRAARREARAVRRARLPHGDLRAAGAVRHRDVRAPDRRGQAARRRAADGRRRWPARRTVDRVGRRPADGGLRLRRPRPRRRRALVAAGIERPRHRDLRRRRTPRPRSTRAAAPRPARAPVSDRRVQLGRPGARLRLVRGRGPRGPGRAERPRPGPAPRAQRRPDRRAARRPLHQPLRLVRDPGARPLARPGAGRARRSSAAERGQGSLDRSRATGEAGIDDPAGRRRRGRVVQRGRASSRCPRACPGPGW